MHKTKLKTKYNGILRTYILSSNQNEVAREKKVPLPIVRMQSALHQCSSRVSLFLTRDARLYEHTKQITSLIKSVACLNSTRRTTNTHEFLVEHADVRVVLALPGEVREPCLYQGRQRARHFLRLRPVWPVKRNLFSVFVFRFSVSVFSFRFLVSVIVFGFRSRFRFLIFAFNYSFSFIVGVD